MSRVTESDGNENETGLNLIEGNLKGREIQFKMVLLGILSLTIVGLSIRAETRIITSGRADHHRIRTDLKPKHDGKKENNWGIRT